MQSNRRTGERGEHVASLSGLVAAVVGALPSERIRLSRLVRLVGANGLLVLSVLLTIVFIVPVSIPGVSTAFGAVILLIGVSRLRRRSFRLPPRVGRRVVAVRSLRHALEKSAAWLRRLDRLARPNRLRWIASDGAMETVNNIAFILSAALLMAPFGLVPLSNTLPALALMFLAVGMLFRDGLYVLLGQAANLVTVVYFAVLLAGGSAAILSWVR